MWREPHEFAAGHIPEAMNLPLSRFDPEELPTGKPPILICQAGTLSPATRSTGLELAGVRTSGITPAA